MSFSQLIAILVFLGNIATFAASVFEAIAPGTAIYVLAIGAAIQAFVARIQGSEKPAAKENDWNF